MADPTQPVRDMLKKGIKAVLPENSPLAKSGDDVLTPEARAKLEAEKAKAMPVGKPVVQNASMGPQEFVNPVVPAPTTAPATGIEGAPIAPQAPAAPPVPTIPDQSAEYDKAMGAAQGAAGEAQKQIDDLNKQRDDEYRKKIEEDEKMVASIQPKDIFAGKATWQKILGGVGMFLGSVTPEGARNVANIIDKEIERDLEVQKANIKLKQDKSDKHYQMLMQKYGSQEAALLAKKKDAYTALGLQVQKLQLNAKNAETRARLAQGAQEIELKKQSLNQSLMISMAKHQAKAQAGSIPGYAGNIKDPVAAREFRTMIAEAPVVRQEIQNLLSINDKFMGGAFSTDARASAQKSQNMLIGKLRVAIAGPGTMSESDRKLLENAIANPTDFFTLGSSNKIKLNGLMEAYNRAIESHSAAYGLQKVMPQGARKSE